MAEPRTVRENANSLTSEEIAAILPHRYPFALVDRILDYEPGQWAIGRKCVIKNARFRKQVTPGDVLTLHCELVEQRGPVGIGKASAYVDGKCAATAELTFVLT